MDLSVSLVPTGFAERPIVKVIGRSANIAAPIISIPVTLRARSGDVEQLTLATSECRDPSGAEYVCDEFLVGMEPGLDVRSLEPHMGDVDGRLLLLVACGAPGGCEVVSSERAVVVVFNGDLDAAMDVAGDWAGVRHVGRNGIVRVATPENRGPLTGRLPVEFAGPVPGDGSVQVSRGDIIEVEYRGPNGRQTVFVPI